MSAIWHHADTDGCDHSLGTEHEGTVYLKVTVGNETCAASVFGTLDTTGPPADCTFSRDRGIFLEGLAGARAKLKALKDEYDQLKSDQKFLDGWAQIASGDKAIARAKALEAKAKTDPAAAKEFAEYKKAAATLLRDIFRVQSDIESVGQQIEEATLSVNDASDALTKCQSGRFLATAGMRASCDDEASALGDAQGRRDAYADVRRLVSRTLPAKLKTDGTRTSRALGSFVRLLPSASAGARPFAAQLTRLLKGSSLLGAWSKTLDSRLAAAKAQVATLRCAHRLPELGRLRVEWRAAPAGRRPPACIGQVTLKLPNISVGWTAQ